MKTMQNDGYTCLARRDIDNGMAITVLEHNSKHTLHVGLLDVDSGNYVDGTVRVFPVGFSRDAVNAYADSLV